MGIRFGQITVKISAGRGKGSDGFWQGRVYSDNREKKGLAGLPGNRGQRCDIVSEDRKKIVQEFWAQPGERPGDGYWHIGSVGVSYARSQNSNAKTKALTNNADPSVAGR